MELSDESADIHDLISARRGGGKLEDVVGGAESIDGERDLEERVGTIVQVDGIAERSRRGGRGTEGGRDGEERQHRTEQWA